MVGNEDVPSVVSHLVYFERVILEVGPIFELNGIACDERTGDTASF